MEELKEMLKKTDDRRMWIVAQALRKGISYSEIHDITMIDLWFIKKVD